jgi:hypothetical protein
VPVVTSANEKEKILRPTRVSLTKEIGQTVPSIEKPNQPLLSQLRGFARYSRIGESAVSVANPSTSCFAAREPANGIKEHTNVEQHSAHVLVLGKHFFSVGFEG